MNARIPCRIIKYFQADTRDWKEKMIKNALIKLRVKNKIFQYASFSYKKVKFHQMEKRFLKEHHYKITHGDPSIERLKRLKNCQAGNKCFIIATGPSLTIQDLELLSRETTFGMNSIVKLYDQTTWRPTYYGIQDARVYEKLEPFIRKSYEEADNIFVSSELSKKFFIPDHYIQFPFNNYYHEAERDINKYYAKFSDDASVVVYDGYSITYSLIEIAVHMGFQEIYLLGVDCNYSQGEKNHFIESGFIDKNAVSNPARMISGYQCAKEYADAHGIKIVNCTRGGMLEVFPRMNLEYAIKENS